MTGLAASASVLTTAVSLNDDSQLFPWVIPRVLGPAKRATSLKSLTLLLLVPEYSSSDGLATTLTK